MSTVYPSSLASLVNPTASDRLNSPSHSAQHTDENDNIEAIQSFLGTESSTYGITYDLRSPNSNGGGHVQTAVKGGTGQITFIKGDILVAQSPSVLAKVAVGLNGQILGADSSSSSGIKWVNQAAPKIAVSAAQYNYTNSDTESSILSQTIPGSVLGSTNAIRARIYISQYAVNFISTTGNLVLRMKYGVNTIATLTLTPGQASTVLNTGWLELMLFANGSDSLQKGVFYADLKSPSTNRYGSILGVHTMTTGTSSIASSAPQTFAVTAQWADASADNDFQIEGWTLEQIT